MAKTRIKTMTFTLPVEIQELLREISKETGLKMSTIIAQSIKKFNNDRS